MSNTQPPISEYIKQGVLITITLALCLFGIKTCRKFQAERKIIIELSSHASESAAYEQFYQENAQENLLKAMFYIHSGVKMSNTPAELLAEVMAADKKEWFSSEKPNKLPIRKALIHDTLLSNYDHCLKLGLFENQLNLKALSKGELPTIVNGPNQGEEALILNIIPPAALPGAEKLLPNMIISPPLTKEEEAKISTPTEFELARAKRLAQQLTTADLIAQEAYRKVIDYYQQSSTAEDQKKAP